MVAVALRRLRFENPVLSKDLRTRMRGARAFLVQAFYVGVLVLAMGIIYMLWWAAHRAGASPAAVSSDLGRALYLLIFEIQAGLIVLITPALTAGAITIEHEQRTYEMLACTRISPRTILTGKLLSSWLFVVMLLTCSLPLAALCLMFGGVSLAEIFWSYATLCACTLFLGSIGVFYSALLTRSMASVMLTYGTVVAYLGVTGIADPRRGNALWPLNPFAVVVDPTEPIRFFMLAVPGWLPAMVIFPLGALLLVNWGTSRLRNFSADQSLAIRALTLLLFAGLMLFGLGRAMAGPPPPPPWRAAAATPTLPGCPYFIALLSGAASLAFMAPFFSTGNRPRSPSRTLTGWMATGLDPRRMFSSELRGDGRT